MTDVFSQGGEIAHSDDCHDSTNILGYCFQRSHGSASHRD